MAEIVHWFVFLTVNLARVNKQIDCVHVMQVGWGITAQKVYSKNRLFAEIHIIFTMKSVYHVSVD